MKINMILLCSIFFTIYFVFANKVSISDETENEIIPILKDPCISAIYPTHQDSLHFEYGKWKMTNEVFGVVINSSNLIEVLEDSKSEYVFLQREIFNWEGNLRIIIQLIATDNYLYSILLCPLSEIHLKDKICKQSEHFDLNIVEFLRNSNVKIVIYRVLVEDFINILEVESSILDNPKQESSLIYKVDSLRNEIRMRKDKINDK